MIIKSFQITSVFPDVFGTFTVLLHPPRRPCIRLILCVCVCVCVSECKRILMNFFGEVKVRGPGRNRLDFGSDPNL